MSFRMIEPGTFTMGSHSAFDEAEYVVIIDETEHQVILTTGFYMQTTEVTQKPWEEVMGTSPSHDSYGIGENYPVNQVSWDDIQDFLTAINAM